MMNPVILMLMLIAFAEKLGNWGNATPSRYSKYRAYAHYTRFRFMLQTGTPVHELGGVPLEVLGLPFALYGSLCLYRASL